MNYDDNQFGDVVYKGTVYHLDDQAVLSNRIFPGWWGDVEDGETYTVEYYADAHDNKGHNYLVYWQFVEIKGEEPEDESDYPWEDEYISQVYMM